MFQRRLICVLTLCAVVFLPQLVLAGNWTQFRGPGGLGISGERDLPIGWSEKENVAWKTAMPGYGSSSPIALNGKLYVTCYSGYGIRGEPGRMEDLRLHVVCIDSKNGKIIWQKQIKPVLPESKRVRDHGYAAATPVTDGENLYIFFGKSGVFKLNLNGKIIWQTIVGTGTHGWGSGTSPVLYENLVIVNASVESKSLFAIDKNTGKEVWRADGMDSSWNTPHLVKNARGETEVAVTVKKWILGFDPKTGEELWRCEGIPDYICPSIVSEGDVLYALGGRSSKTVAVRSGGRGDVTDTHKLWQADVGANVCSPVIYDGHLYWVSDRNRTAYCLSLSDGSIKYEEQIGPQPYASTLLADGRLYVVSRNGGTMVLAAKPQFEQLALNVLDDESTFNASAIPYDGALILRSDKNLYCIKKMN
jgi:outer membrane protein assembly factor BamB